MTSSSGLAPSPTFANQAVEYASRLCCSVKGYCRGGAELDRLHQL